MDTTPFRVGLFPIPGFALMSYACITEPMRAANLLSGKTLFEVTVFGSAQSSGGMAVPVGGRVGDTPPLDMLLVIAGGEPSSFADQTALSWLGRMARRGVILGGVSGGPVILARAGLMAGRRMTVHWEHAEALKELAPDLLIERSLYVIDRDRVTCAGGTAPLDLVHALIALRYGAALAQAVSDWFLHTDIRPPGGAQRAGLVARLGSTSAPVLDAVTAMESHIADPLTLPQLAMSARVSPRQLNRLFKAKLGVSTMEHYRAIRLDVAMSLLRNSSISLTEIGLATGFASSSHFTRAFALRFGHPPSDARRKGDLV